MKMQRRGVLGWAGALARAGAGVTRRTRLGAPGGPAGTFGYRGTPTHAGGQVEQAGEVRQVQGRGLDLRRCQHGHRRFGGRGKFPGQGRAGQPFGVPLDEPWQAGHVVGLQILHDPDVVGGLRPSPGRVRRRSADAVSASRFPHSSIGSTGPRRKTGFSMASGHLLSRGEIGVAWWRRPVPQAGPTAKMGPGPGDGRSR
jgi:hypothetical protein